MIFVFWDTFLDFKNHYARTHQHEPNFRVACQIGSCGYTTKKWNNFKVNVTRTHKHVINLNRHANSDETIVDQTIDSDFDDCNPTLPLLDVGHYNAMYSLGLQAEHNISETAIDSIVESTLVLINNHMEHYLVQIKNKLLEKGISPSVIDGIHFDHQLHNVSSSAKRILQYTDKLCYIEKSCGYQSFGRLQRPSAPEISSSCRYDLRHSGM